MSIKDFKVGIFDRFKRSKAGFQVLTNLFIKISVLATQNFYSTKKYH